jgi:hypothetical protein
MADAPLFRSNLPPLYLGSGPKTASLTPIPQFDPIRLREEC